MTIALVVVDWIRDDPTAETSAIADETLGYFFIFLLFSALSWCTLAYIWSFLFKQDIIGFIVLLFVLFIVAFVDMIFTFIEILFQQEDSGPDNVGANVIIAIRWLTTILLPNLTVKRGLYNLKIRKNNYCIDGVNNILFTGYRYNEDPFSLKEPGIGILMLICIGQFVVGNFILYFLEVRPFSRINFTWNNKIKETKKDEVKITY